MNDKIAILKDTLKPHRFIIFLFKNNINGIGAKAALFMTDIFQPDIPMELEANGI
jgi:hypothetical protein